MRQKRRSAAVMILGLLAALRVSKVGSGQGGHRSRKTVFHCFEKGSDSPVQLRPASSHPGNRITKSPSLYAPSFSPLLYEFSVRCGIKASFERIVGCHCTICSWTLMSTYSLWMLDNLPEHESLLSGNCMSDTMDQTKYQGKIWPNLLCV